MCLFIFCGLVTKAQTVAGSGGSNILGQRSSEAIVTSVPSLTISPDARSGALGDAGAAISADANASYWNSAKLCFIKQQYGGSLSYNPWLRKLVPDMSLNYLTAYTKVRKEEAIAFSLMYFNMGSIQFTDQNGNPLQKFSPQEFAITGNYSRKLSPYLSIGAGLKFIHSNLTGGFNNDPNGGTVKSGNTAAVDFGIYHTKDITIPGSFKKYNWSWGANLSNVGPKISYSTAAHGAFIPTNLRLGTAFTTEIDPYNKFTFILDANKLLVPAPAVYYLGANGQDSVNSNGPVVAKGQNPETTGLIGGMIGSFYKAPGGLREEWQEITWSLATEYWYNDLFAVRCGMFYENRNTGDRQYFTTGFGVRYNYFGLDVAYLIPIVLNNPLAETLRFTLHINLVGKKQESVIE